MHCKWTDLISYVNTVMPIKCDLITIAAVVDNRQRCFDIRGIFSASFKNLLRGALHLRKVHALIFKTIFVTDFYPN